MKKLLTVAALLSVTGLFAAGCGGDDSSTDEAAPTKSAYITAADAVCADAQTRLETIVEDLPDDINAPESQAAIADEIVPHYRDQIEQLRTLTPPEGDEETTAAIYDAVSGAVDTIEENAEDIGQNNPFEEANTLANDYGFEVCGR